MDHANRITYKQAKEIIHTVKSDGSIIKDIKVFQFQEAFYFIGLGWVYALTKLPIVDSLVEFLYRLLAKYRFKLILRPSLENLCNMRNSDLY